MYVLMIVLIISGLMSFYVLVNAYQLSLLDKLYSEELARENIHSGLNLFLAAPFQACDSLKQGLFQSGMDTSLIYAQPWGMFGLVQASGIHGHRNASQWVLVGQELSTDRQSALFLDDQKSTLVLTGNTLLKGTVYVPSAGIKKGTVGRRGNER